MNTTTMTDTQKQICIAEQYLKAETRIVPGVNNCSNVLDRLEEKIAVIGGGPAGLSCAY